MTLRHIVLMSFPLGRDAEFIARMQAGIAEMVAAIPDIAAASFGEDLTGSKENFDYALVLDFADRAAYQRYRSHPAHQHFITAFMRERPMVKARVQYEFEPGETRSRPT
jgi:hypothetical protein